MEDYNNKNREEIFSERVKAGKRTYFFDVKATKANDYYIAITESIRKPKGDSFMYEKHKIFLYKEDFNKFSEAFEKTLNHIKNELMPGVDFSEFDREQYHKSKEREDGETSSDSDLKW